MGFFDDTNNVFFADYDSRTKIKDAVDILKETAVETLETGDQSDVRKMVAAVATDCPQMLKKATEYYARHSKGQLAIQYLFACSEVYSACRECIWEVRRAIPLCSEEDTYKLQLEKALVEVEWLNYIKARDIGKDEKKYIKDRAETVNEQIAKVQKLDPSYTHEPAVAKKGGCYVATAVYGSYDCPQVWVLRRYRDYTLANSWAGRGFIHLYYAVSPTLVSWFGETAWFQKLFRDRLDKLVERLREQGVADTPYADRDW